MPELPEVQTVRCTLTDRILGRRIVGVRLHRREVVRGLKTPAALLVGQTVTAIERHGKQLAIIGSQSSRKVDAGPACICVHLGMTGSILVWDADARFVSPAHCHVTWRLDNEASMLFVDPRRFGGLWTFADIQSLRDQRWRTLGPDALTVQPYDLHRRLTTTRRPIKSALLDQTVVAGLGNIYVDELLFTCRIHPLTPADRLTPAQVQSMVVAMRTLLRRAIRAGGSSVRNYVDVTGRQGRYQDRHRVYGRADQPCLVCGAALQQLTLSGRTTVYCPCCQRPVRQKASRGSRIIPTPPY